MNANEIVWLVVGTAVGYLLGTLATVWIMRERLRRDMHPMQYVMASDRLTEPPTTTLTSTTTNGLTTEYLTVDWDAAARDELVPIPVEADPYEVVVTPKRRLGPVPATTTVACATCGKQYKRVSQHIKLSHAQTQADLRAAQRKQRRVNPTPIPLAVSHG